MHVKPQKLPCWKKQRLIPVIVFRVTINYCVFVTLLPLTFRSSTGSIHLQSHQEIRDIETSCRQGLHNGGSRVPETPPHPPVWKEWH